MALRYPTALGIAAFMVMVATLFFWLAAMSTPITKSIWYLRANNDGTGNVYFGNFGWSAGDSALGGTQDYRHVGYTWLPYITREGLTGALMLVALTAAFGTLAFFALVGSIRSLKLGTCAIFTTMFTILLSTISMFLIFATFVTAHRRFRADGFEARYGPAFILAILGWLLYLFSIPFLFLALAALRRDRRDGVVVRDGTVHEHKTTTTTRTKRRGFF